MASLANIPGRWPRKSLDVDLAIERFETYYPVVDTHSTEPFPQIQTNMSQLPTNTPDELFFSVEQNNEATSPSYLLFEPVLSSVSDNESIDWRRYSPPGELMNSQDDTSEEVKELLASSIAALQARHIEEIERHSATSRRERPLSRSRRASVKPEINVFVGSLDPSPAPSTHPSRLSNASSLSASSFDSGYSSRAPEVEVPSNSRAGFRSSLGLSSIIRLRRKDKTRETGESIATVAEPVNEYSQSRTGECVSCLEDFPSPEMIKISCHSYCMDCFQRLISTALESETHWPVKCCLNSIPSSKILPHLDAPTKKKYKEREAEWSFPAGDRIYCAQPTCSTWIPARYVNTQLHSAKCPKCAQKTCTICRGEFHNGNDCPQDPNLQATINLAEMEGWKRCYSCHALVEHNQGCRHMTCRCKAQFCYICGLRWRTCGCTDTQLAEIQQVATNRRHEKTAREARAEAEAEEERIVLQMVAEFEIAEAEREAREAEARLRIEEEERRHREEERIAAISLRFHRLTNELEFLHDVQRVHMAERYESEADQMKNQKYAAVKVLSARKSQELQQLNNESKAIIAEEGQKFDKEYQARLVEERRSEEDYLEQLQTYWQGKPEAKYNIREARDELRSDQDKEYKFWAAYRRTQLQAVSEREKRRREALGVKQQNETRVLEARNKIDEVEWKRKKWAEGMWAEKVAWERVAMLEAGETQEY